MNIQKMTRQALIERVTELETLLRQVQLDQAEEERLDFAWSGNLGHWYFDYPSNQVTFNPLKALALGFAREEIPAAVPHQFFSDRMHPDDYERVMEAMRQHLKGATAVYEVEYRILTRDGSWRWFYDLGKVTQRSADGKPILLAGIVFDISERKELQRQLEEQNRLLSELASKDGLTNLLNHRAIVARLEEEVKRAGRYSHNLSVLLLDVDHFKRVNDTYGHPVGDEVLVAVAREIQAQTRELDLASRYGGEEFLVVFPSTGLAAASMAAERIRAGVQELRLPAGLRITISGGLATFQGESAGELVTRADQCLYQAKNSGRNQIVICPG